MSARASGHRTFFALLLACGGVWMPASSARAGYIKMDTRTQIDYRDDRVVLRVTSANRGNEPAFQVKLEALHPDGPRSSDVVERLGIGETIAHTFEWDLRDTASRQRVIPILTHYADANYYPLSALTYALVAPGERPLRKVTGRADRLEANPRGVLRLHLRSVDGTDRRVGLRIVASPEIGVRAPSSEVQVPASGEVPVELEIENYSGLPGSVYNVLAVLAEEHADGVVESPLVGVVVITEPRPDRSARPWIVAAGAAAALVFTGWQLGLSGRLRRG